MLEIKKDKMIKHIDFGQTPAARSIALSALVRKGDIMLGGYRKAKTYGLLSCSAGKRMHVKNRVFFKNEAEALAAGYRPCGHCMQPQ